MARETGHHLERVHKQTSNAPNYTPLCMSRRAFTTTDEAAVTCRRCRAIIEKRNARRAAQEPRA